MKYSYRHPDLAAQQPAVPEQSLQEAAALLERRRFILEIATPSAIESTDEEMWHLWDKAELETKAP
jgi:hypothetical protein